MSSAGPGRACLPTSRAARFAGSRALCALLVVQAFAWAGPADAKVRISGLADVNFGALASLETDAVQSQSLCLYAQNNRYSLRADGSGAGGAFVLSGGAANLAYEVRWNDQGGQTNGAGLSPGAVLSGLTTSAQNQNCSGAGPSTTASLILVLPASALSGATQGSYSGTLTLIVAEE